MLITKISTSMSSQKAVNIDIEHYHSRDQCVAANNATSFSSSLSDEKGSKNTNNCSRRHQSMMDQPQLK